MNTTYSVRDIFKQLNLLDRAPTTGLLIDHEVKFRRIFRDRFAEIFRANFAEKQLVKNGWFCANFLGTLRYKTILCWFDGGNLDIFWNHTLLVQTQYVTV